MSQVLNRKKIKSVPERRVCVGREEGEKKDIRKIEAQRNIVWLIPDDIAKPNYRS